MLLTILQFLAQAVGVSLSGVMAPGPMTAATLAAGARRPHAGLLMAVGHGIIEFPLMGLVVLGAGTILRMQGFQKWVGLAGGLALLLLAALMLRGLLRPAAAQAGGNPPSGDTNPILTGVVLTAVNPYFLLWWATIGLALSTQAYELGAAVFIMFAILHWLCDLVWLEIMSVAANRGTNLFGQKAQKGIILVCAGAMSVFGVMFVAGAMRA